MKVLSAIAVLVILTVTVSMADDTEKSYQDYWVTVTSTRVNQDGTRLIYGRGSFQGEGKIHGFSFYCDSRDHTCPAPAIGKKYSLIGTDVPYSCDDYILDALPWYSRPQIVVCLNSVN